jgi:SAM-dependent methyltransferase
MTTTTGDGAPIDSSIAAVASGNTGPRWLFTLTILVGSFLLFLVQPMIARMALPQLGGAPAVWNSAMLVYQALLLGGYAWAHWIGRFSIQRQLWLHGGLLIVAALLSVFPIGLRALTLGADSNVFLFVPTLLLASIGPILLAISAQAPLMQRWFAVSAPGANPYSLYAASNLGSFGGLIAYPLLVEPNMRLIAQSWSWSLLYVGLVILVIACGLLATRLVAANVGQGPMAVDTPVTDTGYTAPITTRRILLWTLLAAVPSGLMLSTTTHLTTDIMAMPLMWAIPLGLYLLSFSVAFAERRWLADLFTMLAPPMLLIVGGLALLSQGGGATMIALLSLIMLFAVAVSLHARLYSLRPAPQQLTLFYLVMAVGGALGGLFCALIAPVVFDWVYEHPILVLAAALLVPLPPLVPWADYLKIPHQWHRIISLVLALVALVASWWLSDNWTGFFARGEIIAIGIILFAGLMAIGWRMAFVIAVAAMMFGFGGRDTLAYSLSDARTRSYFGVYTVRDYEDRAHRTLSHGTTLHGTQLLTPGRTRLATSYYGPNSGVGLAFTRASTLYGADASVGVVGLGTGTLACYRQPGQNWTFFEIDPAIVHIARDTRQFTFLPECAPGVPVVVGDARLKLEDVPAGSMDLLAVDAFSSDAIPLHLLTREAFDVYGRALQPGGIAMVHISNRYVDLEPVLLALTRQAGWHAAVRYDEPDTSDAGLARTGSIWVAMARSQTAIDRLTAATAAEPNGRGTWRPLSTERPARLWTDDYASVLPLLMWKEMGL